MRFSNEIAAYTPQFSSANDPVVVCAFSAANTYHHEVDVITSHQLIELIKNKPNIQFIDVRTAQEHSQGNLKGNFYYGFGLRNFRSKINTY